MSLRLTRSHAETLLEDHTPGDKYPGMCPRCHSRHPCNVYDLAVDWLAMDDTLGMVATVATAELARQYIEALKGTKR